MFIQYNLFFLAAEDHKAKERANTEAGELKVLMNLESVAVFPILHYNITIASPNEWIGLMPLLLGSNIIHF